MDFAFVSVMWWRVFCYGLKACQKFRGQETPIWLSRDLVHPPSSATWRVHPNGANWWFRAYCNEWTHGLQGMIATFPKKNWMVTFWDIPEHRKRIETWKSGEQNRTLVATWRWKHPHLGTEDHISYFALNDEVHPTGTSIFHTKTSLPSSKQKSHLGLSFKLVTSQVAIFQYCLKQMCSPKCLQFPWCTGPRGLRFRHEKVTNNLNFQLQRTLWDAKSPRNDPKPMPWQSWDQRIFRMESSMATLFKWLPEFNRISTEPWWQGAYTCQLGSTGSSKHNNVVFIIPFDSKMWNVNCEHKQSGKQGYHQEPSN